MMHWEMYKPVLTALALPPVPLLALILLGAWLTKARRRAGLSLIWTGVVGIWLCACPGLATWLQDAWLTPGRPVTVRQVVDLAARLKARPAAAAPSSSGVQGGGEPLAIIVLGAGRDALSPEYGSADLSVYSADRLRYGVWLSRHTGVPLGFSGGVGWAQKPQADASGQDVSEAGTAAIVSKKHFGWPLRWVEAQSADTRQNAVRTVDMLTAQGVRGVVVVTHAYHVKRARRAFEEAARSAAQGHPGMVPMTVMMAPMDLWSGDERQALTWLPSATGMRDVSIALRECLGWLMGM